MEMESGRVRMWESLRADARLQDSEIDHRLTQLEHLLHPASMNLDGTGCEGHSTIIANAQKFEQGCKETESAIKKLQAIVLSMRDLMNDANTSGAVDTKLTLQHTSRFEELAAEKSQLLRHLQSDFKKRKEKAELLTKVHSEISAHKEDQDVRMLSAEQDSLRHTHRKLNEILEQAAMNKDRLQQQRQMFSTITDKVVNIVEKVPFVNHILRKIDAKRKREVIIVACVIALCFLFIIVFW